MARLVSAMTIHNIQPSPPVISRNPELFWRSLTASMWTGNARLMTLGLPLIGM